MEGPSNNRTAYKCRSKRLADVSSENWSIAGRFPNVSRHGGCRQDSFRSAMNPKVAHRRSRSAGTRRRSSHDTRKFTTRGATPCRLSTPLFFFPGPRTGVPLFVVRRWRKSARGGGSRGKFPSAEIWEIPWGTPRRECCPPGRTDTRKFGPTAADAGGVSPICP